MSRKIIKLQKESKRYMIPIEWYPLSHQWLQITPLVKAHSQILSLCESFLLGWTLAVSSICIRASSFFLFLMHECRISSMFHCTRPTVITLTKLTKTIISNFLQEVICHVCHSILNVRIPSPQCGFGNIVYLSSNKTSLVVVWMRNFCGVHLEKMTRRFGLVIRKRKKKSVWAFCVCLLRKPQLLSILKIWRRHAMITCLVFFFYFELCLWHFYGPTFNLKTCLMESLWDSLIYGNFSLAPYYLGSLQDLNIPEWNIAFPLGELSSVLCESYDWWGIVGDVGWSR